MPEGADEVTVDDVRAAAEALGVPLAEGDARAYRGLMERALSCLTVTEDVAAAWPREDPPARRWWPPAREENPFNAWSYRVTAPGADEGPLAGVTFAVKDNVAVAGGPMTAGSRILEGFVPDEDAEVVRRLLDAGAVVEGKAACEDLAFSAGSHTSATGPVLNPFDPTRSAGGSSSGCAVLVATRAVDAAIGSDQGGSLAIPAAHCGVVGVKPTHGRVPTRGAVSLDASVDHLGPMARTVTDAARVLESLAGDARGALLDRFDEPPARVALVEDAFAWPGLSDARVDGTVRDTVTARFKAAGADVSSVEVPVHRAGNAVLGPLAFTALARNLATRHASPAEREDLADPALARAFHAGVHERAGALSPNVKLAALVGQALTTRHGARPYALAQRARRVLRDAYDGALADADALAMPAVPFLPRPIPRADATLEEKVHATQDATANTAPFDLTGHPTVTVNAGAVDGLPVGVLLVGRRDDEAGLLRAARAFEAHGPRAVAPRPHAHAA